MQISPQARLREKRLAHSSGQPPTEVYPGFIYGSSRALDGRTPRARQVSPDWAQILASSCLRLHARDFEGNRYSLGDCYRWWHSPLGKRSEIAPERTIRPVQQLEDVRMNVCAREPAPRGCISFVAFRIETLGERRCKDDMVLSAHDQWPAAPVAPAKSFPRLRFTSGSRSRIHVRRPRRHLPP
jgi:hypothetical protein